jgi:acyl-coenzyme A synthetase/AMP-(fatty) acid ligase
MYIKSLINHRLFESDFSLFDPKAVPVNGKQFRSDFLQLRNWLSQHAPPGGVGIKLPKDHRYLLTILACMDAGVVYVPMKDNYPENRIEQIRQEAGFGLLMDTTKLSEILQAPQAEFLPREIRPDDLIYVICTSGSTGKPKAVMVEWGQVTPFIQWVNEKFSRVGAGDRVLQVADFTFDISLIDVGLFLGKGAALHFSQFTGNIFTLAFELEQQQITVLNTVVNNFSMLLDDKVASRADYRSLHTVMMGGGRFSYGLYKKCETHFRGIGVHNLYGVTEVPVYSHCKTMRFDESDLHEFTVSVGTPLGACTAVVVKDGARAPAGEKGEVLLGGGSLMRGYANDPVRTAEVFTEFEGATYYRTGDIGFQRADGDYFITGRLDDTIKYRGYRINLLDVDSYILSRPYVQDCVTVAIEDEETQNRTYCYVILKAPMTEKEVKKDLETVLLEYQIPEHIRFVNAFPTNANGKVCKKTLRQAIIDGKKV